MHLINNKYTATIEVTPEFIDNFKNDIPELRKAFRNYLKEQSLPVGGIKEKILAAKRAKIKEIILCEKNRQDVDEIKEDYLKGLTFHYVNKMEEVLEIALTNQKAKR